MGNTSFVLPDAAHWDLETCIVGLAEAGLAGDRDAVARRLDEALGEIRAGAGPLAGTVSGAALAALLDRHRQQMAAERTGRPARIDVLATLHNTGTLGAAEYAAGLELRQVAEILDAGSGAVRAIDPSKPVVDGGALAWGLPPAGSEPIPCPARRRARAWAAYIRRESAPVRGRRRTEIGIPELVFRVVALNTPLADLDREMRVRKGTCGRALTAALTLYAAMHHAPPPEGA